MADIEFQHETYELNDDGRIVRKADHPPTKSAEERNMEDASVLDAITEYVQARMRAMGLVEYWIPDAEADDNARCNIFLSNLKDSSKLLLILVNQVGSRPGIWSRSLCLTKGLKEGSMLHLVKEALRTGYSVGVLNPNTNSVAIPGQKKRIPIANSFSPEVCRDCMANILSTALFHNIDVFCKYGDERQFGRKNHVLHVWDSLIASAYEGQIYLLTYGNGSSLAVDVVQRQIVRCETNPGEQMRIRAIAAIEPSQVVDGGESGGDNDAATKAALKALTLAYEGNETHPYPLRLIGTEEKLGCVCISVGAATADGTLAPGEPPNVAASVGLALESVLRFFDFAASPHAAATEIGEAFAALEASRVGIAPSHALALDGGVRSAGALPSDPKEEEAVPETPANTKTTTTNGFLSRLFASSKAPASSAGKKAGVQKHVVSNSLTVADFDLLRVVGKGAFGKVMLVRKKANQDEGRIFAMKVLKKSVVAAKGQTEHTRSERSILCEIRHPYIVRLRYAFQSDEKLYLVTDYYNGGSLYYHLRKSRGFPEVRARFYAAELTLALDHLHNSGIIYRDLKLENILMDHLGHVALTDFGLSKENISDVFNSQLTTFCGTAEYIAPELLKGQKYGAGVDWWSFGILLYEMLAFRTPFYDKNRKLMFHGIINLEPKWPEHMSSDAVDILSKLLDKDPAQRFANQGALEIKTAPFFADIDWPKLEKREFIPPFRPDVTGEEDTRYVPKTYLNAKPEDSIDASAKKNTRAQDFKGFTYIPESHA